MEEKNRNEKAHAPTWAHKNSHAQGTTSRRPRQGVLGLLERLKKVRQTGQGRWTARCPAHEDRSPSLSIRVADDGRVLVHCFTGCAAGDVLTAVGLEFRDLFPEPLYHNHKSERVAWNARDVLSCLVTESRIVSLAARQMLDGFDLGDTDVLRVETAADRIAEGLRLVGGAS